MIRFAIALLVLAASPARANDLARDMAPTGTLRASYIATNPVQASLDPATGQVRGPAAAIATELAKRAGLPVAITGAKGVEGVLESVKNGSADIGFLAFDPVRAAQVDFSQNYALAQNTYIVADGSPIRSVADREIASTSVRGVSPSDSARTPSRARARVISSIHGVTLIKLAAWVTSSGMRWGNVKPTPPISMLTLSASLYALSASRGVQLIPAKLCGR